MKKTPFKKSNILLPKDNFEKWAVIACDQFTSDKVYWEETKNTVADTPSTYNITLPEIYLEDGDVECRIEKINKNMNEYLQNDIFSEYKDCMIYIERIQPDGRLRQGIVGAVDLEDYDFRPDSNTLIRATEGTVIERIPPRVKIRKDAPLELPHIMLLINDVQRSVLEPLYKKKNSLKKLYDFDLMMDGGHITGYLVESEDADRITEAIGNLYDEEKNALLIAVGDGNHSLATAKVCYENLKKENKDSALNSSARYALAELGNIHSDALDFEPIYRVMFDVDPEKVLDDLKEYFKEGEPNTAVTFVYGDKEGSISIPVTSDKLITGVIQDFIDDYIKKNKGAKVDYIHGISDVKNLSKEKKTIGFIYDGISKDTLFSAVENTGSLPRKTFSMGHSRDKRYYIECRKIK